MILLDWLIFGSVVFGIAAVAAIALPGSDSGDDVKREGL